MTNNPALRLLASFLALALFLSMFPVRAMASGDFPAEESVPLESVPEDSVPEESSTEESAPEESIPEESVPEESAPEESMPEESVPEESAPEESMPEESVPEESASEESMPEESMPEESVSEESLPLESSPSASTGETALPDTPSPEIPLPAVLSEPEAPAGPGLYFGLLGAHSNLSEGTGTAEDLFRSAAGMPGLDFFVLTDHSDSFAGRESANIRTDAASYSADWAAGKAAATAVTTPAFVGMFGFEMNWPAQMKLGHISTFGTPGFQAWNQDAYRKYDNALENYYTALASISEGVSQFNHPGKQYGSFNGFRSFSADADRAVSLLELDFTEKTLLRYYTQALDRGWHLAPTGGQSIFDSHWKDTGVRTVVHAQSLTEEGIREALKNCRAYATEDPDLEIHYSMDGHFMGSRLDLRHIGDRADLSVLLQDPTDGTSATVEVITTGGQIAARQTLSDASCKLSFSLPPESGYYFLKITQSDGDRAVTAPIWVDAQEDLGIATLSCETAVPVRQEPVTLTAKLYNEETADFLVESLEILADGIPVSADDSLTRIPAGTTLSRELTFCCDCAGLTEIAVRLSGTLEGVSRSYEASLQICFRQSEQVTGIVADGSHENNGLDMLNVLKNLAMEEHIRFQMADRISAAMLKDCRFLLITAPAAPFSEEFLSTAAEFADFGGSIVLCGHAGNPAGNEELNRLLTAIGSTMCITANAIRDPFNNGGDPGQINSKRFNRSLSWCSGISENQLYRADAACAVDPGLGHWLVKARPTAGTGDDVLLAYEKLSGGGNVFAAGSLFLSDENLVESSHIWDEPYANRTFAGNLLDIGGEVLPLSTIAHVRKGTDGQLFRIRGYVTAGTSNPYNTFPDTLYLQDDTGGIAVTPFPGKSIQQGTPLEITGYAGMRNGNRILKLSSWRALEGYLYQYLPRTGNWDTLLDMDQNGGRLVQVEGICREIYCREDDTLAGCLLEDGYGNTATVKIGDSIGNGSDGENDLHRTIRKYRNVRAVGLLHTDEYGNTVIRVRNCEEVVWVPPRNYWNPRTGDFLLPGNCSTLAFSSLGLVLLRKRKKH